MIHELTQSEVCDFQVAFLADQNILWFEIPIEYAVVVKVLDREDYLSNEKLNGRLFEYSRLI